MFVRVSRARRNGKVYEYPQLVESYRRKDGRPAHRVLASLKDLTQVQLDNLAVALRAGKQGVPLVLAEAAADAISPHTVSSNRRYLALAVYDALWRKWRLGKLVDELSDSEAEVPLSLIVEALVLHRCVSPDSKLAASRWYPTTALPELFGVVPTKFNNSRVHRALSELHDIDAGVQEGIARRSHAASGIHVLYVDLTDTWFVGRGPELARRGKTKEGLVRQKVGIALLCDQRGFPLRWKIVQGTAYEPPVMMSLLAEAAKAGELGNRPVVMDRAMGHVGLIDELSDADVRFVTALSRGEFGSFTTEIHWQSFADVEPAGSANTQKRDLERIADIARAAGLTEVSPTQFVRDLGIVRRDRSDSTVHEQGDGPMARLIRETDRMQRLLDNKIVPTRQALADWYGCSCATVYKTLSLAGIVPSVQARISAGEAESVTVEELYALAERPADSQDSDLDELLLANRAQGPRRGKPPSFVDLAQHTLQVRLVVRFNAQNFIDRRLAARRIETELKEFVDELNRQQAEKQRPLESVALLADVRSRLKKLNRITLYDVSTQGRNGPRGRYHQVKLVRNEDLWARRRRYDGFQLIVAHPDVIASAADVVHLYFSKDIVEKDFQTIKSEIDLRPVRHRTDPKVSAHVTVCILALLLQRILEKELSDSGNPLTAPAATGILDTCHLNEVSMDCGKPYFTVTQVTPKQLAILKILGIADLVDDQAVMEQISQR